MSDAVWLAMIVAFPAVASPLLLSWLTSRNLRKDKQADYERADAIAARADARADKLEAATREVAGKLKENNKAVAISAAETQGQLKQIHTLVNSNLTASMQAEMDQREISLALMQEMLQLKKTDGIWPTVETLATVEQMQASITELRAKLTDRLKQTTLSDIEAKRSEAKVVELKRDG